jgi:hypothetical protein
MCVNSPHAERAVLLPSSFAWSADAHLVGEALGTVGSAAARPLDDTRYVLPTLTWQIAAETVGDCATTDHRPENLRLLVLPAYALDAVWACRNALAGTATGDPDSEALADVLSLYLYSVHDADLPGLIAALDRVLAVLTLDLPAARTLVSRLALNTGLSPDTRTALDDVLAAWRGAGVAC